MQATKLPELLSCPSSCGPSPPVPRSAPSTRLCFRISHFLFSSLSSHHFLHKASASTLGSLTPPVAR